MNDGYTSLIELLVVMMIIALLGFIIIPNLEQGERRQLLRRAAFQLTQDFRDMEERAISSRELPGSTQCTSVATPPPVPRDIPLRYGLYFYRSGPQSIGRDRYRMFGDCNDDGFGTFVAPANFDVLLLEREFPLGVELDQMRLANAAGGNMLGNRTRIDVTFSPPDPTVTIIGNPVDLAPQAWYRLRLVGGTCTNPLDCVTIWVSNTGRIYVQ